MKPSNASRSIEQPRIHRLILDAFHLDPSRLRGEAVAALNAEEWQDLRHLAGVHRLGPMLHERLGREGLMGCVPAEVQAAFKAQFRRNSLRNLMLYRELAAVTRLLEQAGIASIALKGAYLAQFAYPKPGLRPMRDLDILVREDQAMQAFELIRGQGYTADFQGLPEAHAMAFKHLPGLGNAQGAKIELHVRLVMPEARAQGRELSFHAWDRLLERSVRRDLGGVPVRFLRPEDLLLHLCVHATLDHHFNVGPLVLTDIAYLLQTQALDWQDFVAITLAGGWEQAVLPPLEMAQRHLGVEVSPAVLASLSGSQDWLAWRESADCLLFSDPNEIRAVGGEFFAAASFGSKSLYGRATAIAQRLFVAREKVAAEFPIRPESAAIYFCYPLRWCRQARTVWANLRNRRQHRAVDAFLRHKENLDRWLRLERDEAAGKAGKSDRK